MAIHLQLDMFESNEEIDVLRREFESLYEQMERVRKGLFSRHNKLENSLNELILMILSQQEEISILKLKLKD